jgi:pimeloyl-ACP methyl ester carboxylesterase
MASLVQDVWLGWEPRLRARRFAPWEEAPVRLVFCPDTGATLDDPLLLGFLEALADRLDVVAWEPPGQGASAGRPGPQTLEGARRLVDEAPDRWGQDVPLVVGGHGLGGGIALAAADRPGVRGVVALDPTLPGAAAASDDTLSTLSAALLETLRRPPLSVPALVVERRGRPAEDAQPVAEWVEREPRASRLEAAGESLLAPPWAEVVTSWVEWVGGEPRRDA